MKNTCENCKYFENGKCNLDDLLFISLEHPCIFWEERNNEDY